MTEMTREKLDEANKIVKSINDIKRANVCLRDLSEITLVTYDSGVLCIDAEEIEKELLEKIICLLEEYKGQLAIKFNEL